ncbi:MAG: TonB family protein [Acidobacteria bacterium]|nr:TonB family protein [Acidobacteriota bacterium]
MFDKLVESSRQKQGRRAGSYVLITSMIYSIALIGFGVLAITGFSPVLAENFYVMARLTPLPPPFNSSPPAVSKPQTMAKTKTVRDVFAPPKEPVVIPPSESATEFLPRAAHSPIIPGMPPGSGSGYRPGIPGGRDDGGPPVPPPTPKPAPKIEPAPEVKSGPRNVSEGVLQGIAIRRIKPAYPTFARQARIGGLVQVQVTISEDGRVIEATAVNGHQLLRSAAVEAARQWLFTPTTLSRMPVKVQGVLTFNFVLE